MNLTKEQSYNEAYDERVTEIDVAPDYSRPTGIKVILNGKQLEFDVEPMLINSRTMVPMRVIFEALGAEVSWDGETQTAIGETKKTTVKITIGKDYLLKNDNSITEEIAKLTKQILVINKLQAQGYIESASYYEKLNEINTQIATLTKEKKSLMGKDECDVAIKNTTTIISIIDKKGAISKFEKSIFETMVEKIIAQKSVLTFVLINGVKLTIDAEE